MIYIPQFTTSRKAPAPTSPVKKFHCNCNLQNLTVQTVMVCFPFLFHVPLLYSHLSLTPFLFAPSLLTIKEQSCPDCPIFGQNVQKFYISSFGLFVQKFPDTILISSPAMPIILKISTTPPIKPPMIQFRARTPMLPLMPKFFGISHRHIRRIPNGHPAIIQYKNQSKPSALLHTG